MNIEKLELLELVDSEIITFLENNKLSNLEYYIFEEFYIKKQNLDISKIIIKYKTNKRNIQDVIYRLNKKIYNYLKLKI